MRFLLAATAIVFAGHAAASPLSCTAFLQRLDAEVHAGGDKVATPRWTARARMKFLSGLWSDLEDVAGLTGNVQCGEDDHLMRIEIESQIDSDDLTENGLRLIRARALAAASICAVEPAAATVCATLAKTNLFERAYRKFLAAKRRGDDMAGDLEEIDLKRSGAGADVTVEQGYVRFSVGNVAEPIRDIGR